MQVNIVTAVLMFIGVLGVLKSLFKKSKIKCACLGVGFNLPMKFVTVVEDSVMMLMALYIVWQLM